MTRAAYEALLRELPRSVEPVEAVEDREHWYRRNHPLPASPGYTSEQRQQVEDLHARLLDTSARVGTHP
ncbi:hypothetical protein [Streptomyces sp. NBC_00344]|uniref:hypothetical protein n=1 Tax=Streptomyces sp. NBC_00344 TaxID=2975720 RepID=UPI002E1A4F6B